MVPIDQILYDARAAARHALSLRTALRRNTVPGSKKREDKIRVELERLSKAMAPVRSLIGQLPYRDDINATRAEQLRAASAQLQYERRQLKKMRRR